MSIDHFKFAKPVFAKGFEKEKNITCAFKTIFVANVNDNFKLKITGASVYRIILNGEFLGYGPARAAHGYYRVDYIEIPKTRLLSENALVIEVAGYNVNGYYLLDQPSFLQAELYKNDEIIAYTKEDNKHFEARIIYERVQKVQRYTFQRPFVECYKLDNKYCNWKMDKLRDENSQPLENLAEKSLINRGIPFPSYDMFPVNSILSRGKVRYDNVPDQPFNDRSLLEISDVLKGFYKCDLEICLSDEVQTMAFDLKDNKMIDFTDGVKINRDHYDLLDFGKNKSGFFGFRINCESDCTIYLIFDEMLCNGDIDFMRGGGCCAVKLEFTRGVHDFESFEPYTMRYLKIISQNADVSISKCTIREYVTGAKIRPRPMIEDEDLLCIYDAAVATFRDNTTDILMDCPSRERAGWLCDSFFIARSEYILTGKNDIERNYLENYLLPDHFDFIPEGMVPMCYPADHHEKVFIPNWALWLVLELNDYQKRNGDLQIIHAFKDKIYSLFSYFKPFENEYGLLEKLSGWVFIEWSKANDLVQDVNFPTNMLYSAALKAAGELYQDIMLIEKSIKIKKAINDLSFDGIFYNDNAIRDGDKLVLSGERTEVCQYYAFFFDIANKKTHLTLLETLINDFGPQRVKTNLHKEIYFANSFIGNYLRLDILARYGMGDQVLKEIKGYFLRMAKTTGTLWEFDSTLTSGNQNLLFVASCNHGFTSMVAYWILELYKSEEDITYDIKRKI